MIVYVVCTQGDEILGIFTTKERAEKEAAFGCKTALGVPYSIDEYELDKPQRFHSE